VFEGKKNKKNGGVQREPKRERREDKKRAKPEKGFAYSEKKGEETKKRRGHPGGRVNDRPPASKKI